MILIICVIALVTALTRFLPFFVFYKKVPNFISNLGKILPSSLIAMIFIYSCKDFIVSIGSYSNMFGIMGFISVIFTLIIHLIFKNFILSIVCGTIFHIVLVNNLS